MNIGNNRPKVSIGLPAYNGEKDIEGALDSLLGQDFTDFELIISDNASTDRTGEICERCRDRDKRVKYYRYPQNVGAIRNFNRVFELSSGDYFMWAACDDTWEKNYISSCVKALDDDPLAALCYSVTNFVADDGSILEEWRDTFSVEQDSGVQRYLNLIANLNWCNCFYGLIRRSMLNRTKLYQDNNSAGDVVLLAELVLEGKFIQLEEALFNRHKPKQIENFEEHIAGLEKRVSPHILNKGNYLPFCNMIKDHIDLIKHSSLNNNEKIKLAGETIRILLTRYKNNIIFEIDRAIKLISMGRFRHNWGQELEKQNPGGQSTLLDQVYAADLLAALDYAFFLVNDRPGIFFARAILLLVLGRREEAGFVLSGELARRPDFIPARKLLEQLDGLLGRESNSEVNRAGR